MKFGFLINKLRNITNTHLQGIVWEKFWIKFFGPMGHPWGTWAPYLPIGKRGPSNFWCPSRFTPTSTGIWTNIWWSWSVKRAFGLRRCVRSFIPKGKQSLRRFLLLHSVRAITNCLVWCEGRNNEKNCRVNNEKSLTWHISWLICRPFGRCNYFYCHK